MSVFDIEPELLESLYHGNGYSHQTIADIFGCSSPTIRSRMKDYDIVSRGVTDFTFNNRQKEIFEGCMLGDGGLVWQMANCHFRNTDIHEEYLIWLQNKLGIEHISIVSPDYVDGYAYSHILTTRVIPSIREEHKRWYPYETRHGTRENRHPKIIPKDIELTPIKLLFWYIGDGTYNKYNNSVSFGNHLVFDGWLHLSKKICKVLDVDDGVSIVKHSKDDNGIQRYNFRLGIVATSKFFKLVDDLGFDIPNCYQYKFGG